LKIQHLNICEFWNCSHERADLTIKGAVTDPDLRRNFFVLFILRSPGSHSAQSLDTQSILVLFYWHKTLLIKVVM
jgi:hypothetical protein